MRCTACYIDEHDECFGGPCDCEKCGNIPKGEELTGPQQTFAERCVVAVKGLWQIAATVHHSAPPNCHCAPCIATRTLRAMGITYRGVIINGTPDSVSSSVIVWVTNVATTDADLHSGEEGENGRSNT